MTSPVSAVEAIEKAMEGVTPGPWTFWVDTEDGGREYAATVLGPNINDGGFPVVADIPPRTMHGTHVANAAYVAACNPVAMREVLTLARQAEALKREIAELRRLVENGQSFANQIRSITYKLNGQAYSSTVSELNQFDAVLRRARTLLKEEANAE